MAGENMDHETHKYCEWCGEVWPGNYMSNCGRCTGPLAKVRQYTLQGEPRTIF